MLRPCQCPWVRVEIAPEVEPVLLRAGSDPTCSFPHREDQDATA